MGINITQPQKTFSLVTTFLNHFLRVIAQCPNRLLLYLFSAPDQHDLLLTKSSSSGSTHLESLPSFSRVISRMSSLTYPNPAQVVQRHFSTKPFLILTPVDDFLPEHSSHPLLCSLLFCDPRCDNLLQLVFSHPLGFKLLKVKKVLLYFFLSPPAELGHSISICSLKLKCLMNLGELFGTCISP